MLWALIGWQFAFAEYVGRIVMIALVALLLRRFVSPRLAQRARRHASGRRRAIGTTTIGPGAPTFLARFSSISSWSLDLVAPAIFAVLVWLSRVGDR